MIWWEVPWDFVGFGGDLPSGYVKIAIEMAIYSEFSH